MGPYTMDEAIDLGFDPSGRYDDGECSCDREDGERCAACDDECSSCQGTGDGWPARVCGACRGTGVRR